MTTQAERPAPPRRPFTLIVPTLLASAAFFIGGGAAHEASGVAWGVLAAAGLLIAMWLARIEVTPLEQGIIAAGAVASAVIATVVLPDLPDSVSPALTLRFGAAWIPLAAGAGFVAWRKGLGPAVAVNVGIVWVVAGLVAIPAATAFGRLVPVTSMAPGAEPLFGGWQYAFIGLFIGFLGSAATLAAVERLHSLMAGTGAVFVTAFAGAQVGFSPRGFINALTKLGRLPNNWPIDWDWAVGDSGWKPWMSSEVVLGYLLLSAIALIVMAAYYRAWRPVGITAGIVLGIAVLGFFSWVPFWEWGPTTVGSPIVETFRIAIIASVIGTSVALPVAFLASRVTSPDAATYLLSKSFMNFIRTIPDLFWALLFVASLGIGPFGGAIALVFFSLAIMAKLLSETIDAVDTGPLEAAKATGSRHFPAVRASVLPQVLPNYVAYALYIFEINIRASVVLGLVGAGGIGRILERERAFFRFDRVIAIVAVIFVIVFVIEQLSVALRRRLV